MPIIGKPFTEQIIDKQKELVKPNPIVAPSRYFVLVCLDLLTSVPTIAAIYTDYDSALMGLHDSYKKFMNDDHIVRQVDTHNLTIYKRNFGYLFNSKTAIMSYRLISHQQF